MRRWCRRTSTPNAWESPALVCSTSSRSLGLAILARALKLPRGAPEWTEPDRREAWVPRQPGVSHPSSGGLGGGSARSVDWGRVSPPTLNEAEGHGQMREDNRTLPFGQTHPGELGPERAG